MLKKGKEFHAKVQRDFLENSKDGEAYQEQFVSFEELKRVRQKSGRMDVFIDDLGDFVTIIEIKATDWDKIKPKNVKRNLYRHQRQVFQYVEKYVEIDNTDVCLGIIYPEPPKKEGLREFVENYMTENYGLPVYWYSEISSEGE